MIWFQSQHYSMTTGIVYALVNHCIVQPETNQLLYKIGKTTDINRRVNELFNTSVPINFNIVCAKKVSNMDYIEKEIHNVLSDHRYNNQREFFNCHIDKITSIFNLISGEDVIDYSQNKVNPVKNPISIVNTSNTQDPIWRKMYEIIKCNFNSNDIFSVKDAKRLVRDFRMSISNFKDEESFSGTILGELQTMKRNDLIARVKKGIYSMI